MVVYLNRTPAGMRASLIPARFGHRLSDRRSDPLVDQVAVPVARVAADQLSEEAGQKELYAGEPRRQRNIEQRLIRHARLYSFSAIR